MTGREYPRERCQALTKAGKPCQRDACDGSRFCFDHERIINGRPEQQR